MKNNIANNLIRLAAAAVFFYGAVFCRGAADVSTNLAGTYSGLFYENTGVVHDHSGFFKLTVNKKGVYSCALKLAGQSYSFSGRFSDDNSAQATLRLKAGQGVLGVSLKIDDTLVCGTVSNASWTAELEGDRLVYGKNGSNSVAGRYALALEDENGVASKAVLVTDGKGGAKFKYTLSDKTTGICSSSISPNSQIPVYAALYSKKGSILGWMTQSTNSASGLLSWIRTGNKGFTNTLAADGSLTSGGATDSNTVQTSSADSLVVHVTPVSSAATTNVNASVVSTIASNGVSFDVTVTASTALTENDVMAAGVRFLSGNESEKKAALEVIGAACEVATRSNSADTALASELISLIPLVPDSLLTNSTCKTFIYQASASSSAASRANAVRALSRLAVCGDASAAGRINAITQDLDMSVKTVASAEYQLVSPVEQTVLVMAE